MLGVTSLPLVTTLPATKNPLGTTQTDDVFLQNLADELHRSNTIYSRAAGTAEDVKELIEAVPVEKLQEIDEVSREFESLLLFMLFKQMWETIPESTMFGNGLDSEIYREMWLEETAKEISSGNNSIGVADSFKWEMILREMSTVPVDEQINLIS